MPILLNALQRVEYRGYDSCGVAIHNGRGIDVARVVGYVEQLRDAAGALPGTRGIGHTRWATVGDASIQNAHPHLDCTGGVAVVHNGSVENHYALRRELEARGHRFRSDTDTEALAHLLEETGASPDGVADALARVHGPYAVAVLFDGDDTLYAARRGSPIIVGLGDGETMVGSDVPAVQERSREYVHLEDGDVAALTADGVEVWNRRAPVRRRSHAVRSGPEEVDLGGYPHFLLKEIHEQPRVLRDTLAGRLNGNGDAVSLDLRIGGRPLPEELFFLGCGSAAHAAMIGASFFSTLTDTRVQAMEASEVVKPRRRGAGAWSVLVSQSGETADTVDAARAARAAGHFTLALTNVQESSITRVAHRTHALRAGQEVSVASTKTYLAQLVGLYLLGLSLYPPPEPRRRRLTAALRALPHAVQQVLAMSPELERLGEGMAPVQHAFIIGKGVNYPTALEGALKFKEVAYLHAEGYASGELKHGPFALLGPETPVIAIIPKDDSFDRMLTAVEEVHSRGAPVTALTDHENAELRGIAQAVVRLPATDPQLSPVVNTVALQLMAYACARARECPIDRPRNLAKSVTVH